MVGLHRKVERIPCRYELRRQGGNLGLADFQVNGDATDAVGLLPRPAPLHQQLDHGQQGVTRRQTGILRLVYPVGDAHAGAGQEATRRRHLWAGEIIVALKYGIRPETIGVRHRGFTSLRKIGSYSTRAPVRLRPTGTGLSHQQGWPAARYLLRHPDLPHRLQYCLRGLA